MNIYFWLRGNRKEIRELMVGEITGSPERRVVGQDGLATQIACTVRSNQEGCYDEPKCTIPPGDPERGRGRDPQLDGFNFELMHLW